MDINNIIIPAPILMGRRYRIRNPTTCLLTVPDNAAKTSKGLPIPIPKATKPKRVARGFDNNNERAKNAAMNAGLQGSATAPKKNPEPNAPKYGFLNVGDCICGINLLMLTLKISKILITNKSPNAIGDTISTTDVNDTCSIVVKTSPNKTINATAPNITTRPNSKGSQRLSLCSSLFAKNAINPG